MENNSSAPSFIPRDAGKTSVRHPAGGGLLELLALISIVMFVASGALGVGMFLYNQFLQANSTSKIDQLERAAAAFEPALVHELARLDDRMRAASDILGHHIAPSAFFRMLEQATITTVSFRSLNLEAVDPQRMSIRMDGVADSVNAIALQADLFSKVGMVTSPIFSNIDRRPDGVHFGLSAQLNPSTLNYSSIVRGLSQGVLPSVGDQSPAFPFAPVVEEATGSENAIPGGPTQ